MRDMDTDPFDDLVFICTLELKRVYDGVYCENKHDGGYGHCGGCDFLRIQEYKNDKFVKEFFGDFTPVPVTPECMTDNPDFLEIL
jgi:hypothetical protein